MSLYTKKNIRCPKCGQMSEMPLWDFVDGKESPDVKQDLLRGRVNMFECPSCSYRALVPQPMLYRDDERKLMISFCPSDDPVSREKMYESIKKTSKTSGELEKLEGYNLRFVSDYNELMEKLLIFDNGLNDKAIEVVKLMVLMQDEGKMDNRDCRFGKIENEKIEFMISDREEKKIYTSSVPKETYDTIYKQLLQSGMKPYSFDWERVNSAYAVRLLNGFNNVG